MLQSITTADTVYHQILNQYPDVLTVKDLQEILRIDKTTAYQLLHDGVIPCRKIGRIFRISKMNLIDYLLTY